MASPSHTTSSFDDDESSLGELEESQEDIKKALAKFAAQMDDSMFPSELSAPRGRVERRVSWVDKIPTRCEKKLKELTNPTDIDDVLFDLLADKDKKVSVNKFWNAIKATGLRKTDPRLNECRKKFAEVQKKMAGVEGADVRVDKETFSECVSTNIFLIGKAFKNDMVIPEFYTFTNQLEKIYNKCKTNCRGKPADYIPQLARVNPEYWAVSMCTVDGQRYSLGDTDVQFCLQSTSKPLNYALAISDMGSNRVHNYVGQEPSGRSFNELTLDHNNKPHNPMINAGAIVVTSLLKPKLQMADRFDYVFNEYKRLAGNEYVGFSNATYLSERETADRNFALGYYMRECKCFPEGTDLVSTLEFYFQLCSVEVNAESASVMAATLANGGICPITGEKVLAGEAVRNTLSLMYSCGMYDYSGQFAFKVGLPAKSGVAGAILLVVPNVMGICCFSPPLDSMGNSCRGVQFCEELISMFNFHNYDDLSNAEKKMDPRKRKVDHESNSVVNLLFGAAAGDVTAIRRFALSGMDMSAADYDNRTALHLAAAEGHKNVAMLLLEQCKVPAEPRDRWGNTPLDDAIRFGHDEVADYMEEFIQNRKRSISGVSGRRSCGRRSPKGVVQMRGGSPSSGFSSESPSPIVGEKIPDLPELKYTTSVSIDSNQNSLKPLLIGSGASLSQPSPKEIISDSGSPQNSGKPTTGISKPIPILAGTKTKEMSTEPSQNGANPSSSLEI